MYVCQLSKCNIDCFNYMCLNHVMYASKLMFVGIGCKCYVIFVGDMLSL